MVLNWQRQTCTLATSEMELSMTIINRFQSQGEGNMKFLLHLSLQEGSKNA